MKEPPILTDLSSANGTYVNRESVTEPRPLEDGDMIEIGDYAFVWNGGYSSTQADPLNGA